MYWGYTPFKVELDSSVKMHSFEKLTVESTLIQNKTVTNKTFFQHESFKYHQLSFVLVTTDQPLFCSHNAFWLERKQERIVSKRKFNGNLK